MRGKRKSFDEFTTIVMMEMNEKKTTVNHPSAHQMSFHSGYKSSKNIKHQSACHVVTPSLLSPSKSGKQESIQKKKSARRPERR